MRLPWPVLSARMRAARDIDGPEMIPPMIVADKRLVILWSAKAASASVCAWGFFQAGLLDEVQAHHPFPHRYRMRVYQHSDTYREAVAAVLQSRGRGWHLVRTVRDPMKRFVSSVRHAIQFDYVHPQLTAYLGRPVTAEAGLSFREFGAWLSTQDLARTNPHHRSQVHVMDGPDFTFDSRMLVWVDGDRFGEGLRRVEQAHGLPAAPLQTHRMFKSDKRRSSPDVEFAGDDQVLMDHRFNAGSAKKAWPGQRFKAIAEVQGLAQTLYAKDRALMARVSQPDWEVLPGRH